MIESSKKLILPMDVQPLVPHQAPMSLLDQLLEKSGGKAKASATMPMDGLFYGGDFQFQEYFIELVAQAMAAAQGYEALAEGGKTKDGMVVGIDTFSFYHDPVPGAKLDVSVSLEFEFGTVKVFQGTVSSVGEIVAEGKIKVWENPGEIDDEG